MTDTHSHLYFPDFEENIDEIMTQCRKKGPGHIVLPNVDEESIEQMKRLHARFPDMTSMAIGLHPTEVKEDWERVVDVIKEELKSGEYIAMGEMGMDLYWDKSTEALQKEAFRAQLKLADESGLPVIIHCRDAFDETLEVIKSVNPKVPLIFHSFTADVDKVRQIREVCDPWFGINGVVTYKNAPALREALPEIGLDKIVLETDCPYLTPVPHRGKPNNSYYVRHVCDKVAECLEMTPEEVEAATDKNARLVFNLN